MKIAIIDYGAGNLRSIYKALVKVRANPMITNDPKEIEGSDAVILPGVGAFGDAMKKLEGMRETIERASEEKPFLGICLGMQLLMGKSEEALHVSGLGLVKGKVVKFSTNLKVPHMGWNTIQIRKEDPLLKGICSGDYFYFVHSYYVEPENPNVILATTEYGIEFASIIRKGNVWGCQQHPEKSSKKGLQFLKNFVSEVKC